MVDFYIKQNDTRPNLEAQLKQANGTPINLTTANDVRFHMKVRNDTTVKTNALCTIANATFGNVQYAFTNTDTNTAGHYYGEFVINYSDGKVQTVPTKDYIYIQIVDDIV